MPPAPPSSRLRLIPIFLAQAFGIACGVAGVKLSSTLLPPKVLGLYSVFLTFAPIGMWVVHAGLVKYMVRHWAAAPSRAALLRETQIVWARRLPWLVLAATAGAFILPAASPGHTALLGVSLFAAASLLAAGALAQAALQAEGAHWADCLVTICASLSRTFLPLLVYAAAGGAMLTLELGFTGHALITAAAGAWALRRYWRRTGKNEAGTAPSAMSGAYGGPLFIALAASGWILAGLNRWIVAWFYGPTEAGYFALAGGAAIVLVSALGAVFVQYFQPGIFALGDNRDSNRPAVARRVDRVALTFAGAGLITIGAFALVSPWLVGPLIHEKYRAALPWIFPSGCFAVATITTVFYQSLLLAGRRENACAPVELSTAAVLLTGCVGTGALGAEWFARWLVLAPLVPWVLTRPFARRFFFRPDAGEAPAPAR